MSAMSASLHVLSDESPLDPLGPSGICAIDEKYAVIPATDDASRSQYLARLLAVQHVLSAQVPRMTPLCTCARAAGIGILGLVVRSYNASGDSRRLRRWWIVDVPGGVDSMRPSLSRHGNGWLIYPRVA